MAEKVLRNHTNSENKSEFVFPGRNGKKRTECKRPLLRIRKQAELPNDFRILQGLRHVYASNQAKSGTVDLKSLQLLLAHKSPLMTRRYAHMVKKQVLDEDSLDRQQNYSKLQENEYEDYYFRKNEESIDPGMAKYTAAINKFAKLDN